MALPPPTRDRTVHQGPDREFVHESAVDTDDGEGAAVANGENGLTQRRSTVGFWPYGLLGPVIELKWPEVRMSLQADGVDAGIRAAPGRHVPQHVKNIHLFVVD